MQPILEIQQISKQFRINHQEEKYLSLRDRMSSLFSFKREEREDFWALKDVSFSVQPGESLGIIGRNGAGKSTLLKILSKITPPTEGRIISRGRMASLLEVGTGFHQELSGRENIYLNGSILGMRNREIQKHFDEIVDFSGVSKFLDTPLKHYSSGMQLRLAFAVAAFLEPEILVIDEVLAVGDAEFQKKCLGKMEEVANQGRTILFVSHNMSALEHLCTKAIILKEGKLVYAGKSEDAVSEYLKGDQENVEQEFVSQKLAGEITLKELTFKSEISSFDPLEYSFSIVSPEANRITDLSILLYNHLNERVAIIDLRDEKLFSLSATKNLLTIKGRVEGIPLVEGIYSVGLFISSTGCSGDFLNLKKLSVLPLSGKQVPYAVKYRGHVELINSFQLV